MPDSENSDQSSRGMRLPAASVTLSMPPHLRLAKKSAVNEVVPPLAASASTLSRIELSIV